MFPHELQRPQRPRAVDVFLQCVFVCETTDEAGCRVLRDGKDRHVCLRGAIGAIAPDRAEPALAVFPQQFWRGTAGVEPRQSVHRGPCSLTCELRLHSVAALSARRR